VAPELHRRKSEILMGLIDEGRLEARPGASRLLAELQDQGTTLAVATTGSRSWVDHLLERLLADIRFEVVITGDDVEDRKPDPEAFELALQQLDVPAHQAVVVEDSAEGVEAAKAADLACAVVVNGYTADHDLEAAELVLDGFGEESSPARVLADRRDTGCKGVLDAATLARLAEGPA
jgi:HAD superfamily hydrolase (TIGR01509 family)